jgi:hypothetical protein
VAPPPAHPPAVPACPCGVCPCGGLAGPGPAWPASLTPPVSGEPVCGPSSELNSHTRKVPCGGNPTSPPPPPPRVRSHCRSRKRGADYLSEYDAPWMSSDTKRPCDRTLPPPPPPPPPPTPGDCTTRRSVQRASEPLSEKDGAKGRTTGWTVARGDTVISTENDSSDSKITL